MTKEEVLDKVLNSPDGFIMSNDIEELKFLDELVEEELLLNIGKVRPDYFQGFNESYSYVPNDEKGWKTLGIKGPL